MFLELELELESSLELKILSLCFTYVSLEGEGITGSIYDSYIQTPAVTRRMVLAFLLFTSWPWGG